MLDTFHVSGGTHSVTTANFMAYIRVVMEHGIYVHKTTYSPEDCYKLC